MRYVASAFVGGTIGFLCSLAGLSVLWVVIIAGFSGILIGPVE